MPLYIQMCDILKKKQNKYIGSWNCFGPGRKGHVTSVQIYFDWSFLSWWECWKCPHPKITELSKKTLIQKLALMVYVMQLLGFPYEKMVQRPHRRGVHSPQQDQSRPHGGSLERAQTVQRWQCESQSSISVCVWMLVSAILFLHSKKGKKIGRNRIDCARGELKIIA